LKKIDELVLKLKGWKEEGEEINGEKEKLIKVLEEIGKKIQAQDRSKVDMQTIKHILSDIEGVNSKTTGFIEDVDELIKKVSAALDDWNKFAEEHGEKTNLI